MTRRLREVGELLNGLVMVVPTIHSDHPAMGVCDLNLADDNFSISVNQEWLAERAAASEAAKDKGYFDRRAQGLGDADVDWFTEKLGNGMTTSYDQVGKVSGKRWRGFLNYKKQETPVDHKLRFDFSKQHHFWSGSEAYVEFWLTSSEYASITAFLVTKSALVDRMDLQDLGAESVQD